MATTTERVWDDVNQQWTYRKINHVINNESEVNPVNTLASVNPATVQSEAKATVSESDAVKAAKAAILKAKHDLLRAQGKEPGKKGKPKLYTFQRVPFGAQVEKAKIDKLRILLAGKNNTELVNLAVDALIASLEST